MQTTFNGTLTEEAVAKYGERCEDVMQEYGEHDARPKHGSLTIKYMANREHAVANDAALRSITPIGGIIHFQQEQFVGALPKGCERYVIDFKDLPDDVKKDSRGLKGRSCIIDPEGKTWLEVPWGTVMPSYWRCSDMGSDTWPHALKYYYKYGIRGSEKFDEPHRHVRNRECAISRAGGNFIKAENGVAMGFTRAPWGSEANLQLVKGGAKELFANFDETFVGFQLVYEGYCRKKNWGKLPAGFGSKEHQRRTWLEMQEDKILLDLGDGYSPSRWASWSDRFLWNYTSFDVMLMIVIYILTTRGVVTNFKIELPGLVGILKGIEAIGGVAAPDDAVELDLKSLREAAKAMEARRHRGCKGMLIVAESLCNGLMRKLGFVTAKIPQCVENKMMKDLSDAKEQGKTFSFFVDLARGQHAIVLKRILAQLSDSVLLSELGFITREEIVGSGSLREDNVAPIPPRRLLIQMVILF